MIHKFSRYLLTLVALLAMTTGAWADDTYTVTFSGFSQNWCNTTIDDATMPYAVSSINDYGLNPWQVISWTAVEYTNVSVTSGGDGKVSVNYDYMHLTITITGAFEGTATIHCEGTDDNENPTSRDV